MDDRGQMQDLLLERLKFETLLSDLSAIFVNIPANKVDDQIEATLRRIVEFLGFDRGTLLQSTEDGLGAIPTHVWAKPGYETRLEFLPAAKAPWITKTITEQLKILKFASIDDFPPEAEIDKKFLQDYGVRSYVVIPLVAGGKLVGGLGLSTVAACRSLPDELFNRLGLIGGVLAGALERKRAEESLRRALAEVKKLKDELQAENLYLRREINLIHGQGSIIGQSEGIRKVLKQIEQVAGTDATVLITGETGTGKELVARAVHDASARKSRPMVCVNCAGLPKSLIESELFGRERGAYTGAISKQVGRFEIANGTTMLLDEIGDLPPELQAKLLRVLQDGEFERLGNPKTIKVDVRVIASTNRDLIRAVKNGQFRADLYYRLNVFPITAPPLRERLDDIPSLVQAFASEFSNRFSKRIERVCASDVKALQHYAWPGNVRELRHVVERAVILSNGVVLRIQTPNADFESAHNPGTLDQVERKHILETLKRTNWRVSGEKGAARILGINSKTLESRMKRLGIRRGDAGQERA